MFCPNCGSNNADGVAFCANCGTKLDNQQPQQEAQPQYQQPQYQQPQYQQPQQQYQAPYQPPYVPTAPVAVPGKGLGITSMILGIIALSFTCLLSYLTIFLSIPGLILGCIGNSKAKSVGAKNGMAVAGIITSAISIGLLVVLIIWAVAVGSEMLDYYDYYYYI
jgi:hypothetical protein